TRRKRLIIKGVKKQANWELTITAIDMVREMAKQEHTTQVLLLEQMIRDYHAELAQEAAQ
ncbi:MAG: hypothetical protein ABW318_19205, partial [Vicinamibacterales bacterium]